MSFWGAKLQIKMQSAAKVRENRDERGKKVRGANERSFPCVHDGEKKAWKIANKFGVSS